MRSTRLIPLAMAFALVTPVVGAAQGNDPDIAARGSGARPSGWDIRFDRQSADPATIDFKRDGSNHLRVVTGPAAILWDSKTTTVGPFVVEATFVQQKKPSHSEAYGLIWGGANLKGDDQSYFYLIVRGDGKYMVKHRAGSEVHELVPWTDHAAIVKEDATGKARNALKVESTASGVKLYANGKLLRELPADATADGIAGLRVNHNLDVAIEGFRVGKP